MLRLRRTVGRIERRVRQLPTYVVVLGSCLLGMFLTLLGESPETPLAPRSGEVWFPMRAGASVLVAKTRQSTCELGTWETRKVGDAFLAVKVPATAEACTCLETLVVAAERDAPYPRCGDSGKVSYGAH